MPIMFTLSNLAKGLLLLFLFSFLGCKTDITGDKLPNKPPKTFLITDTIARDEADRFNTNVHIQWWGDDPDGFVMGYEYTFDKPVTASTVWLFTTQNDSTFKLNIPAGNAVFDFQFTIRAIDNLGLADPNPVSLVYPVRNSPPSIQLTNVPDGTNPLAFGNPTLSFPILRFNWTASDPDGDESIVGFDIWLNDTTQAPLRINAGFSGLTIRADDFAASVSTCSVFPGQSNLALPNKLQGLLMNDSNRFFIRAVDISGANSAISFSRNIFVKRPISDILFVQTYSTGNANRQTFFLNALSDAGYSNVETLELFRNENSRFTRLAPDARTQNQIFALFKTIVWASPDLDQVLFFGKSTLNSFLNAGGKLVISTFSKGADPITAAYFDFTPIDSLSPPPTGFSLLMNDTCRAFPIQAGYPELQFSNFLSVFRPIVLVTDGRPLYRASVLQRNNTTFAVTNFLGNTTFMGIVENPTNNSKVVLSTLELDRLNNNNQIANFFRTLFRNEFGL